MSEQHFGWVLGAVAVLYGLSLWREERARAWEETRAAADLGLDDAEEER